jgi:hypothetical protein
MGAWGLEANATGVRQIVKMQGRHGDHRQPAARALATKPP